MSERKLPAPGVGSAGPAAIRAAPAGWRAPFRVRVRPGAPHGGAARLARAGAMSALALAGLLACYSYRPLVGELPAPGDEVRVRMSMETAAAVSARVGHPLRSVQGTVLSANPDSLRLDVGWGALFAGTPFFGRRDTLSFSERDILELDRREFSRGRTALLGAGAIAVIAAVIRGFQSGGGNNGDTGNDTDPF